MPALLKAQRTQEKASRVGYEWAGSDNPKEAVGEAIGELLFAITNLARHFGVDSESALEKSTAKFAKGFRDYEDTKRSEG